MATPWSAQVTANVRSKMRRTSWRSLTLVWTRRANRPFAASSTRDRAASGSVPGASQIARLEAPVRP
jgi:hypothetical protein